MPAFAVLLPMKSQKLTEEYRSAHLDFLERLQEGGHVLARGPFVDGTGGLVIYQAPSAEAVETLVKEDPYVEHGARDYEIHEWAMVSNRWDLPGS
ncbi:hypothetical protein HNR44_000422 [Geomicrobium halophilum]|uniref:YCII-related domain-containing protein n=1 Tax=Geomicrobium halophilum TaxID=549000 RepID=A0A841PW30_9BACL|nr:YciI family protein [Geomicrobium halophilum]MBB6448473.1 hypothetical protein [Geomicrobium halophilum]